MIRSIALRGPRYGAIFFMTDFNFQVSPAHLRVDPGTPIYIGVSYSIAHDGGIELFEIVLPAYAAFAIKWSTALRVEISGACKDHHESIQPIDTGKDEAVKDYKQQNEW